MEVKVYIDNVLVNAKVGLPIVENLQETFDTATLVIPFSKRSTEYLPDTQVKVEIRGDDVTATDYYYYVIKDYVDIVSKNPLVYEHTILLEEPTARLKKITCRNIMFTQPIDGTTRYYLIDVLNRIRNICPLEMTSKLGGTRLFEIGTDLANKIAGIPAPQLSIGESTVFEALKIALSKLNIIPKMINFNTLGYEDFNKLGEQITLAGIHNKLIERASEYDVKTVVTNINNTVSDNKHHAKIYPGYESYTTFKNLDSVLQDTNSSMVAWVDDPIEKIIKFQLRFSFRYTKYGTGTFVTVPVATYDFTKYVLERSEWDLLNVSGEASQSATFYYTQRSNFIGNILTITNWDLINVTVLENAIKEWFKNDYVGKEPGDSFNALMTEIRDILYNVEYIPYIDVKVKVERNTIDQVLSVSEVFIDQNQTLSSYRNTVKNLTGVINRIGNTDLTVEKLCKYDDRYKKGQFYQDIYTNSIYIVTQPETVLYNDYVVSKAKLTKNFNRLAQFIQLEQEQRFYNLDVSKAQKSYDTYTEYIMFSYNGTLTQSKYNDSILNTVARNTIVETLLSQNNAFFNSLTGYNTNPIKQALIVLPSKRIAMSVNSFGGSNILNFVFGFQNPKVAGYKNGWNDTKPVRVAVNYTDDEGLADTFTIELAGTTKVNEIDSDIILERGQNYPEIPNTLYADYFDYTHGTLTSLKYVKDPNEIFGLNYQLQCYVDPSDYGLFVIGDAFTENNRILNVELCYQNRTDKIYVSTTETYSQFDTDVIKGTELVGAKIKVVNIYTNTGGNAYMLQLVNASDVAINVESYKSWAITTNGKLLLAVNCENDNLNNVKIYFKNKREDN